MSPSRERAQRQRAGLGLVLRGGLVLALGGGLSLGCPAQDEREGGEAAHAETPAPLAPDPVFRQTAHQQALTALRSAVLPALRRLDPVAAAEVEGAPLRPPGLGAGARAADRDALEQARREAQGIRAELLSPADGVVLRTLQHALLRGRARLQPPPWRDDPSALVDAMEPYLHALQRRLAAGQCDDGCGLAELGPALRDGLHELGAASVPALTATREDLAALRQALPRWTEGLPAEHPVVAARTELAATLTELEGSLARAVAALPTAQERAWDQPVAPAEPGAWMRRPARWGAAKLSRVMDEEAYGGEPQPLFERAELTVMRLRAMIDRDAARVGEEPALPRPFDAAACEAAWAPLQAWARAEAPQLVPALDCAAALRELPPGEPSDARLVLLLVEHGLVEPSRRALVAATGVDVALVRGRAAPLAQGLTLQIAIAAGSGRRAAALHAMRAAHQRACLAAAAVWTHGELGELEALQPRLVAHGCEDVPGLVAAAEARPRAALHGLGLILIGDGPADAAALDRYWWAPMGLVRDLALPPPPPPPGETDRAVTIEELEAGADPNAQLEAGADPKAKLEVLAP